MRRDRLKLLTLATALLGVTAVELALVAAHLATRRVARQLGLGPSTVADAPATLPAAA